MSRHCVVARARSLQMAALKTFDERDENKMSADSKEPSSEARRLNGRMYLAVAIVDESFLRDGHHHRRTRTPFFIPQALPYPLLSLAPPYPTLPAAVMAVSVRDEMNSIAVVPILQPQAGSTGPAQEPRRK